MNGHVRIVSVKLVLDLKPTIFSVSYIEEERLRSSKDTYMIYRTDRYHTSI